MDLFFEMGRLQDSEGGGVGGRVIDAGRFATLIDSLLMYRAAGAGLINTARRPPVMFHNRP